MATAGSPKRAAVAAWQPAARVRSVCEEFLRDRPPNAAVEDAPTEPPKLAKGESLLDAIERIRHRGRELLADANRIRSSPYPSSWAKAQVRAQVAALAQRGAPDVTLLVEHGRHSVTWPMQNLQSAIHNADRAAVGFTVAPDAVALFAWAFRDQLVAALDRAIDEEADDEHALDHGEREKREAEVLADLLMVEQSEAALVWAALAQGMPCEHRGDCSAQTILQCRLVTVPTRDGPGSSLEHASYSLIGGRW
jgi:hypothetical protein